MFQEMDLPLLPYHCLIRFLKPGIYCKSYFQILFSEIFNSGILDVVSRNQQIRVVNYTEFTAMIEQKRCLTCEEKWCVEHECRNSFVVFFNPFDRDDDTIEEKEEEKIQEQMSDFIGDEYLVDEKTEGDLGKIIEEEISTFEGFKVCDDKPEREGEEDELFPSCDQISEGDFEQEIEEKVPRNSVVKFHFEDGITDSSITFQDYIDTYMMRPSQSQDQLFSITDFSPNWAYSGSEIKVLITGKFLKTSQDLKTCKWSCMFGEVEVPAEVIANGVLRCHTPLHKPGRVLSCVTCSNGLACSEVREFDYRAYNAQDVDIPAIYCGSSDEVILCMRFAKLLCPDFFHSANSTRNDLVENSHLINKISSLFEGLKVVDDQAKNEKEQVLISSIEFLKRDSVRRFKQSEVRPPVHISFFDLVRNRERILGMQNGLDGHVVNLFRFYNWYKGKVAFIIDSGGKGRKNWKYITHVFSIFRLIILFPEQQKGEWVLVSFVIKSMNSKTEKSVFFRFSFDPGGHEHWIEMVVLCFSYKTRGERVTKEGMDGLFWSLMGFYLVLIGLIL